MREQEQGNYCEVLGYAKKIKQGAVVGRWQRVETGFQRKWDDGADASEIIIGEGVVVLRTIVRVSGTNVKKEAILTGNGDSFNGMSEDEAGRLVANLRKNVGGRRSS